ncbi:MAG TPA: nucleotide exchange factor GrpE [Candidatus Dormibacteraeota bacterium]|nr:nucleotide exchange factor GrpE [Candidatus Dormibacteraeota bacterium]
MPRVQKSPSSDSLKTQINDLTAALQRERADAINLRRLHEEQIATIGKHTKTNVIRELLPVIDNFERALHHAPHDLKNQDYLNGIQAIVKQFEKTLQHIGVERIQTVGTAFDPKYHEAVSMEEGEGNQEIISQELQAGYKIGEDVIRHAMVRVKTK